jgi:small-conductance mechanosensitive channel
MGWFKKVTQAVNQVQQDVIKDVQKGVEHATQEVYDEQKKVIDSVINDVKDTTADVNELQQKAVAAMQDKLNQMLADAVEKAKVEVEKKKREIIEDIFNELLMKLEGNNKWYLRLLGSIIKSNKQFILEAIYKQI